MVVDIVLNDPDLRIERRGTGTNPEAERLWLIIEDALFAHQAGMWQAVAQILRSADRRNLTPRPETATTMPPGGDPEVTS